MKFIYKHPIVGRGTSTVPSAEAKPVNKLTGDVNGDGTVNIFDLVIAAGSFGEIGTGIMGDVNGDGGVNIFDLVTVAGNFVNHCWRHQPQRLIRSSSALIRSVILPPPLTN